MSADPDNQNTFGGLFRVICLKKYLFSYLLNKERYSNNSIYREGILVIKRNLKDIHIYKIQRPRSPSINPQPQNLAMCITAYDTLNNEMWE